MKITPSSLPQFKQNAPAVDKKQGDKLFSACQELESMVMKQMLDIMRQSVPQDGLFSGGYAEKLFQSMQDENLSAHLAKHGGLGFGDVLYRQLTRNLPK